MTQKTYKAIMVGNAYNHTRDRYKFYKPEIKRFITTRDVKWEEWKLNTQRKP